MAGNIEDAEDYAQEAWIQVWRQIGSYRFESSFATWLYRLVSNVCLQKLRQRSRVDICNVEDMIHTGPPRPDLDALGRKTVSTPFYAFEYIAFGRDSLINYSEVKGVDPFSRTFGNPLASLHRSASWH